MIIGSRIKAKIMTKKLLLAKKLSVFGSKISYSEILADVSPNTIKYNMIIPRLLINYRSAMMYILARPIVKYPISYNDSMRPGDISLAYK